MRSGGLARSYRGGKSVGTGDSTLWSPRRAAGNTHGIEGHKKEKIRQDRAS